MSERRETFQVVVSRGIWRGCDVLVEPPTPTRPARHFGNHGEALAHAEQLATLRGWPLVDRAGDEA